MGQKTRNLAIVACMVTTSGVTMGAEPGPASQIVLPRQATLALLTFSPGTGRTAEMSRLIRAVATSIETNTDFRVVSSESGGWSRWDVEGCSGQSQLACWIRVVEVSKPRFTMVVSVQPVSRGRFRLVTLLIDMKAARSWLSKPDIGLDEREDGIFQSTARTEPVLVNPSDSAAFEGYFERIVSRQLKSLFDEAGHWAPLGAIRLSATGDPLVIELDGTAIGKTNSGTTIIRQVPQGAHRLRLSLPEGDAVLHEVTVLPNEELSLTVDGRALRPKPLLNSVSWYGGLALTGAGALLTTVAIALPSRSVAHEICPGCDVPTTNQGFASWCELTSTDPGCRGRGLLAVPFGYSVMATGLTAALLAKYLEPDESWAWVPIVAGLLVGSTAYGVSAALNPAP